MIFHVKEIIEHKNVKRADKYDYVIFFYGQDPFTDTHPHFAERKNKKNASLRYH